MINMEQKDELVAFEEWQPPFGLFKMIKLDWVSNPQNSKGKMITLLFRIASFLSRKGRFVRALGIPYLVFYRIWVEWILGVELPPLTRVGTGLAIYHGQGLVVNNRTVIGNSCMLRQGVTLGNRRDDDIYGCPRLGDGVVVAANAMVLGRIVVGSGAIIAAGAVVIKDVAEGSVMVGPLAKAICV